MCICQDVKPENSAPVGGGSNDVGASLQSLGQECEDWPVQRVTYIIIIIIINWPVQRVIYIINLFFLNFLIN